MEKNLLPYAIVLAALIVAGAVVFTGLYMKGGSIEGLGGALEQVGEPSPAAVVPPAEEEPEEEPEYEIAVLENLANCLVDKGFKFYGASWCGWCQRQKEIFKTAGDLLPYTECIDEETQEMTAECEEVGISSFPTWILPDGVKNPGFKDIARLAEFSGCEL